MQSRYYNPEWGRFLNADVILERTTRLLGNNVFSYSRNNPIVFSDTSGFIPCYNVAMSDTGKNGFMTAAYFDYSVYDTKELKMRREEFDNKIKSIGIKAAIAIPFTLFGGFAATTMITAGLITEAGLVVTGTGCVIAGAGCAIGGSISYTGNVIGDYLAKDIEVDGVLNNSVTPEESKQILTDNLSIFTNVWIKNPITGFLADKVVRKAVKGIDKWLERTK